VAASVGNCVANGDRCAVEIKPAARKELEALPDNVLARLVAKLETLRMFPRPVRCKKLKGSASACSSPERSTGTVTAIARGYARRSWPAIGH
jgi:hypothetical protein